MCIRKRTVLIALVVLALGLVGTGLSTLYKQNEYVEDITANRVAVKVSYGFPLAWHGYSYTDDIVFYIHTKFWDSGIHWFSSESLLLDAAFWFAISLFVSFVAIKSARALNLGVIARAGVCVMQMKWPKTSLGMKTSIMLLVMSLFFIVIGVGLCLVAQTRAFGRMPGYLDVGIRLIGSGTVTLIATLSVMLWKPHQQLEKLPYC